MRIASQLFRPFLAIVFCALLMLPSKALAIYPSGGGLPDVGLDRSLQGSDQATEAFKEKYPFYERDEDGKPITKEFVKYDLSNYDLSGLDLRGALFSVATLKRADLEGANLEGSIAYATHFEEANLTNVNFRDSVLTKSFFMATTIDGADFSGAIIDDPQREAMCSRASGVNPVTGVETYDSLDCLSLDMRSAKS
ncbi:pentapeptide repeats family protein [Synechococcus sp. BIOS-E4-1]|uniref:pentapeptide repeat-containing protein n=2 Tax=Synechococcus TaxID=1129 RepID=UPI00164697C0|nr:pentapeptide repeat-containing protein [Synechococcus sp. BIOS-E4-1]QNI56109.1 pentapeptide repeats family protein [Synechococcus sp. BIOS-E4-1]